MNSQSPWKPVSKFPTHMTHDTPFFDFQVVLDSVAPRIEELISHLLPNARKQAGCYRCGDASGAPGSSFSISTRSNNPGSFIDHSDPSIRGNAIGLWALARGVSYEDAGRALAGFLGVQPSARLYMPKKRPEPKVERTGANAIQKLNKRSIEYAFSRGLTEETLLKAECGSTDTHIAFPHWDCDGKLVLVKYWSCDDQKHMFTNADPVPVLFAKKLVDPVKSGSTLIICEGQWDALTWIQLGYPAVSIPSGANNHDWISEDWNFLNCFSQIYLDFDDDQIGREAEAVVKTRLGIERCRSIRYRFKDANDALKAGEEQVLHDAYAAARDAPIDKIVVVNDVRTQVRDRLNKTHLQGGVPLFLPQVPFEFRPHEVTFWYGLTSHGKSSALSNQICYAASRGKMCMMASFEQASPMTIAGMLTQFTADPDIGGSSHFDEALDALTSRVLFFDAMERANPDELIATMTMAHKQMGVTEFVVDNIITLEVDRQDNTAQASVADKFRIFAARYPVHVHEVGHPRKPSDGSSKPPAIQDIRGASEWGDMAHNIICVWRDVEKAQKMSEMRDEGMDPIEIMKFDREIPDGKIFIRKQRETGDLPMASFFFDKATKRSWKEQEDMAPYWYPKEELTPGEEEPF